MKRLSLAAEELRGQPMFKILSRIKQLEREGKSIIHMEIGDPDFSTPKNILEATKNALDNGYTHYSDSMGDYDFRCLVAENNLKTRGFRPDIAQVLVTPGANIMIYYAVRCLVNPGEEVIVQNPCFPTYLSVFNFCGVKPVFVALREDNEFRIKPEDIEQHITEKTRLIIINSPHNPTGAVLTKKELDAIAQIALERGIYLYLDEIYSRMNYGETPFYSPSVLDACKDRIIVANGFSKAFAMTGFRLGVGIGPQDVMAKMGLLLETTSSCVPSFIQKAAMEAISGDQSVVKHMMATYKKRRDILVDGLNDIKGISCLRPGGAFYVFPNISEVGMSSEDFAFSLLDEAGVGVCSGEDFGSCGKDHVRLCYANSEENIKEGLRRIKNFVESKTLVRKSTTKVRVCDYIADFVYKHGIKDVFMVSGGGLMYLTDGLACNKDINVICCHHEQAVSMAACAYGKYKGMGCGYVTTGCGGTNTMTGLLNAYQDNTPCLFISGQCKRKETIRYTGAKIRQFGVQEADIVELVSPITKYAVMVDAPEKIRYCMEKAFYLAKNGRPGPVWIDVPLDIQSAQIDVMKLEGFDPAELDEKKPKVEQGDIDEIISDFSTAQRPVIIAGAGVRLSGGIPEFDKFVHQYKIPFVTSRMGTDILPTEDPLYIGRIGNKGNRAANFAVANSDYVLVLGSRLSVSSTGQQYEYFAREAKVTVVDIDENEHQKNTVHIEKFIHADVREVLNLLKLSANTNYTDWADKCKHWKDKWRVCLPEYYNDTSGINMYVFVEELSKVLREDSVVIGDAGSAVYVPPQALRTTTKNQRYITSGAQAEMGFSLPAAVGVSVAKNNGEVFAITGDGSLQMNIQELQTLKHYALPVKLFVWNNDGYLSIRATQRKFFNGRFIGTDKTNGVSFPNLEKIAYAYDLKYVKISSVSELHVKLEEVLSYNEPVICEVMSIRDQEVVPSISSKQMPDGKLLSMPPEDMYPFLDRSEFFDNMIITPTGE